MVVCEIQDGALALVDWDKQVAVDAAALVVVEEGEE